MPRHVDLMVAGGRPGATQPVEIEALGAADYVILRSPGFVEGIAAGDTIRVTDPERGLFEVVARGGNVAVKFGAATPIARVLPILAAELESLGGRLDGSIEKAAVFTVPATVGFERIEAAMATAVQRVPGSDWWYGNVYDEAGAPLGWWEGSTPLKQPPASDRARMLAILLTSIFVSIVEALASLLATVRHFPDRYRFVPLTCLVAAIAASAIGYLKLRRQPRSTQRFFVLCVLIAVLLFAVLPLPRIF